MSNSGGEGEQTGDLEDGEIFDEEDDTPAAPAVPPPPPVISIGSFVDELKKKAIPPVRKLNPARQRRLQKRLREREGFDEKPFRNAKQRRRSDDVEKKDKNFNEDEEMREMSPLRGEWDHQRPGFGDELMDEDEDEPEGGRRGGRGFQNRRRGGRNGRGGRKGMNNRRDGGQFCRFFLQGKCQRGNDCPYSHANHPLKYELCKFYMKDCCAKKDRCPFMHSEFPCKYFHSGKKCYAGKKCKFSHAKISPQLRANLIRDSKEMMEPMSPPEESMRRRERNRERHKDKDKDKEREHRNKEKRKDRERRDSKEEKHDRYTLHFKVDPRTISDDEAPKTPMPSPPRENHSSDRGSRSPEVIKKEEEKNDEIKNDEEVKNEEVKDDLSPNTEVQLPDPKDSGIGEELPELVPSDLPTHLYKRIQQQQREASLQDEDEPEEECEEEKETEDFKDENWYSSEDEDTGKDLGSFTAILNKIKQQPQTAPARNPSPPAQPAPAAPVIVPPSILPDIDINVVSKLLSTVRETIQQKQNSENLLKAAVPPVVINPPSVSQAVPTIASPVHTVTVPSLNLNPLPPLTTLLAESQPPAEKRRVRDPRLRGNSSEDDVDLRRQDVDLRQLPFKPAPMVAPASEIDASITSHPPIEFQLIPFSPPPQPDYSHIQPKNVYDPRLRRYLPMGMVAPLSPAAAPAVVPSGLMLGGVGARPALAVASRDPRQARILPNDPRRRQRLDSDLRQGFNHVDVDLRQPPHIPFK